MIIQCRQCRTKFRFDDSLMQGSGVWLRCSRCGHVYFQENTVARKPFASSFYEPDKVASEEESIPAVEVSVSSEETPSVFHRDEHGLKSLDKIMTVRKRLNINEDIDLNIEKPVDEDAGVEAEENEEIQETDITEIKKKSSRRGSGSAWKIALWSLLVIVAIPLLIYFYVFPQFGAQITDTGEYLIKTFNEFRGVPEPPKSGAFINQMVKLQDVRYRRVTNYTLGQIGVLEGTAVNRADYPLSRIKVKGEIVDAYSVVMGERMSYAGNILSDDELTNLPEEEMMLKLLRPEGLNNSNDRIMPNEQIPFMIVFPNEPAGVIKTTVMTVGAEHLL